MTLTREQARAAALALMAQHPCEYDRDPRDVAGDVDTVTSYVVRGRDVLPERVGTRADLAAEFERIARGVGVDPASDEAQAALVRALGQHEVHAMSSMGGVISHDDAVDYARKAAMSLMTPGNVSAC